MRAPPSAGIVYRSRCPLSDTQNAMRRPDAAGVTGPAVKGITAFVNLLDQLHARLPDGPGDVIQYALDHSGYLAELVAEHNHEADGRIENLAELATQAADFDDVLGFLETVALVADSDGSPSDCQAPMRVSPAVKSA